MAGFSIKAKFIFEAKARKLGNSRVLKYADSVHPIVNCSEGEKPGKKQIFISSNKERALSGPFGYCVKHIVWPLVVIIAGEIIVGLVLAYILKVHSVGL